MPCSSLDGSRTSGHDRIVVLQARRRQVSHLQAQIYADMAAVVDAITDEFDDDEWAVEAAAAEIRAALRLTRRAAESEVAFALELRRRLPRVYEALESGNIDVRRARTLSHGTAHLSDDVARCVTDRAPWSARRGSPPASSVR